MNNIIYIHKTKVIGLIASLTLLALLVIMPTFAFAGTIVKVNPKCKSDCTSTGAISVKSPITTYSPVPTPVPIPTPAPAPAPSPTYIYNYDYNTYPTYPTPTYPTYYPQPSYPAPYYPAYSPLGVSCYSTPTRASVGESVVWRASAYGGNGSYYITWYGSESLSGYGTSIVKTYYSAGSKYASVTVTSDGQTVTVNCNNVEIYGYNYNYPTTYAYPTYNPPTYNPVPTYTPPANTVYKTVYKTVTVKPDPVKAEVKPVEPDNSLSASSFFSLNNVPWGWVGVLIILILLIMIFYLIYNKNKII